MSKLIFRYLQKSIYFFMLLDFLLLRENIVFSQQKELLVTKSQNTMVVRIDKLYSKYLKRHVVIDVFLPPNYHQEAENYPVLYANDGQDMEAVKMKATLDSLYDGEKLPKIVVVAVHTCGERIQEYGTAAMPDYKGRGSKAAKYTKFVMEELKPYIHQAYRVRKDAANTAFMGFSLGGLSAFDITWNHPYAFSKVGVFSGSFWWRKKAYEDGYDDENDRIMHVQVRQSGYKKGLKMWFEVGTKDETDDRNNNGIIDAIDDTLDLMTELEKKGYKKDADIAYLCIEGGEHNQKTWANCLPNFLTWAFVK